jgi:hypothetical protein
MALYRDTLHLLSAHGYYKYDILSSTWAAVAARLPRELFSRYHSAVQDKGLVYLVGGRSSGKSHLNEV